MAKRKKPTYTETFKAGVSCNKDELKRMIDENLEKITMEVRKRSKYADGSESLVVEIYL